MTPEVLTVLMFATLVASIALGHPLAVTLAGGGDRVRPH